MFSCCHRSAVCNMIYWTALTHCGRVTHIYVSRLTIIGSDNGLSPGRRQAIIWTNAGILLIWPLGTNFSEILIGIQTFSFMKMSSVKWRPFCLSLNLLIMALNWTIRYHYNTVNMIHIDGLAQDCSISSANALEILQSCTKPLIHRTQHCGDWGRTKITEWTHKRHPISRPHGRVMGCLLWGFEMKLDYSTIYNGTPLWRQQQIMALRPCPQIT